MEISTDSKKIDEVINSRLIDKIYPSKEDLKKILRSGERLTIYHGIDPTASSLHLGHSTNYFLLKEFQDLGHKIIILIGDFTAQIGDPTDKFATRKSLIKDEVLKNCETYKKQVSNIIDFSSNKNPAEVKFNGKWLSKMSFEDVVRLASNFTVNRMLQRDMFQKRLAENKEIHLHEFLYPLMQGYDSVALNADMEIGGTDQTFNMMIGRDLVKIYNKKEKFVITTPLLVNSKTGKKLMSKSEGNYIGLDDSPNEMYGKVMALDDAVLVSCFELCTSVKQNKITEIKSGLKNNKFNPRDIKADLAKEIVSIYHGKQAAKNAENEFNKVFKNKKIPSDIKSFAISSQNINILELLVKTGLAPSKSEAKRLVEQNAIKVDKKIHNNWKENIAPKSGMVIQAGKRRFARIS